MDLDLTKADVAKLPAEQQATIARIALDRGRIERETLDRASRYPGQAWVPLVLCIGAPLAANQIIITTGTPYMMTWSIAMLIILTIITSHKHWGTSRRMDAMLRLIKEQRKELERLKGAQCVGQTFLSDQNEGSV